MTLILTNLNFSGKTISIEEAYISIGHGRELQIALPDARLVDVSPLINHCRLIKDPNEIFNARIAARLADVGMNVAVEALAGGATERDTTITVMHKMNEFWASKYEDVDVCDFGSLEGGQQNGLSAWILSGPRKFLNCANPTSRKPARGETVSAYMWTVANGMHAELERTVCIGPLAEVERRAIAAILEIRSEVDPLIKPGTPAAELYETTRKAFEARGYGNELPGRIGHSIGLGPHESFSINASSPLVVEPGMIIMFEPNIEVVGVCATQISDTILITESGREYRTRSKGGYLEV